MHDLVLDELSTSRRGRRILLDVSCRIEAGERVLLGGANGAGKSTLLRCMATLHPWSGRMVIDGRTVVDRTVRRVRPRISYLSQAPDFPRSFRVEAFLRYQAFLSEVPGAEVAERVGAVTEAFGLTAFAGRRLSQLSGGERRLVHLAGSVLARPGLLLLDEPTVGLDAEHRVLLRRALRSLGPEVAIVASSHAPDDYELLADRVVYLAGGVVAFDGPVGAFLGLAEHYQGDGRTASRVERAIGALEARAADQRACVEGT